MPKPRSLTLPVIMYPEGVIVGSVRSGKNATGRTRHVANHNGRRVGTFDTFREARDAVLTLARAAG